MHKITTAENKIFEVECIGCSIAKKEIDVIGGIIVETDNFNVSQDLEYPTPGLLIIGSNQHVRNIAELTSEQALEFGLFLHSIRQAMKDILGIEKITIVQEEKSSNSHFHVWLFPWHEWMNEIGTELSDLRKIMEYSRENHKTSENLDQIRNEAHNLRKHLQNYG